MLLQVVISAGLMAFEDFSVGSLDQPITLWMSNRCIVDLDATILAVNLEHAVGELEPTVGDDHVRDSKPTDDGLDKLDCRLLVDLDHRGCFWPLGEHVDGDVQIPESSDGPGEWTQDVQPQYNKWP
jgi:hypothetical protein